MAWTDAERLAVVVRTIVRMNGRRGGHYHGKMTDPPNDADATVLAAIKRDYPDVHRTFFEQAAAILAVLETEPCPR